MNENKETKQERGTEVADAFDGKAQELKLTPRNKTLKTIDKNEIEQIESLISDTNWQV